MAEPNAVVGAIILHLFPLCLSRVAITSNITRCVLHKIPSANTGKSYSSQRDEEVLPRIQVWAFRIFLAHMR